MNSPGSSPVVRPAADGHAVVSIAFLVRFSTPVDNEILEDFSAAKIPGLPGKSETRTAEIDVDEKGRISPGGRDLRVGKIEKYIEDDDGNRLHRLVLDDSAMQFITVDYRGWSATMQTALAILSAALSTKLSECSMDMVGLRCDDRFFVDDAASYSFDSLFRETSEIIPRTALVRENRLWHSSLGWIGFSPVEDNFRVCTLKCETNFLEERGLVVDISYTANENLSKPTLPANMLNTGLGFEELFRGMFEQNKHVLRDVLSDEARQSVGL